MADWLGEQVPDHEELRRAVVALWVVAVVGAGSFLVYVRSSGADLPLSPVAVVFAVLIAATVAVRTG